MHCLDTTGAEICAYEIPAADRRFAKSDRSWVNAHAPVTELESKNAERGLPCSAAFGGGYVSSRLAADPLREMAPRRECVSNFVSSAQVIPPF